MTQTDEPTAVPDPDLAGIGGWLILPLIHLVFSPFYTLWSIGQRLPDIAERAPAHPHAAQGVFVLAMLPFFAFLIFCLVCFLQKRREVPWLMTVFYGLTSFGALVSMIARLKGYEYPDRIAGTSLAAQYTFPTLTQLALGIGLIFYFHNSVRVANTFTVVGPKREPEHEPKGLGGWLILPLAAVVFFFAITLTVIVRTGLAPRMFFAFQHDHWLVLGRQLFLAALAQVGSITCLYYALWQKRAARRLLITYFSLWASVCAIALALEPKFNPVGLFLGLLCLALVAYLLLSRRVKNTFVR
jgi:hypothetical protein